MRKVTTRRLIDAPVETVFDLLADRENYSTYLPLTARLVRPGVDSRQGVGAIHRLGLGPVGVREKIVEVRPEQSIRYELVTGRLPVREHSGEISFVPHGASTQVDYSMATDLKLPVPGLLVDGALRVFTFAMLWFANRKLRRA
ncbi:hypothetical protein GOHSU_30_00380 [Gordonia hirsuta DSM 44140 = NBRC 16056]|uniref:Coenzyme Q-binding protein COQ10 START domain-containing protein n=1 Tax=Gordonia hirsuta DSM 44140 = NBRC 16056 TaxID=1121927 RepID=L7LB28_9ACTN|nr:SRPBCC family protein [Gordonia hirsuta]GAC58114.1 hypothetical protein GOHSU_30_00380 [Gordonia hirsuta DSM 44140 = NBRC 16056]